MPIDHITLQLVNMRLLAPFETSFGVEYDRQCVIVRVDADGLTGWGEAFGFAVTCGNRLLGDTIGDR